MSITEMEVRMDCRGCERRIRKALSKLEGVDTIEIDMEKQKVTVTGFADQMTVLGAVRNTGKKAELWPYPYDSEYHPFVNHYYQQSGSFASSMHTYNYENHGYNGTVQGYYQSGIGPGPCSSGIMDHSAATLFSDENPHACTLM